jgi:hypothetical protein
MDKEKESRRDKTREIIESIDLGSFPEEVIAKKFSLVFSRCIEDMEDSINKNSESNNALSNKIWWLNLFILLATVAGVTISGISLYLKFINKI